MRTQNASQAIIKGQKNSQEIFRGQKETSRRGTVKEQKSLLLEG